MAKREHYKGQSYIDWLKSLGCVFYCPFDGANGTMDLINNVAMSLTGYGACLYYAGENMYRIKSPSGTNQHIGIWANGITAADFPTDEYTTLYNIKKISSSSSKYILGINPNSDTYTTTQATSPMWNGTTASSSFPSLLAKCGYTSNTSERRVYQNGALANTYAPYSPYYPSNWVLAGSGILLSHVPSTHSWPAAFQNVEYYIGEVYLFNRVLTLSEIRQIQGYE